MTWADRPPQTDRASLGNGDEALSFRSDPIRSDSFRLVRSISSAWSQSTRTQYSLTATVPLESCTVCTGHGTGDNGPQFSGPLSPEGLVSARTGASKSRLAVHLLRTPAVHLKSG